MLPDRTLQLLAAYVDGELNARQMRAARRLLRRSVEARQLLRDLRRDAALVRGLPQRRLPADFAEQVLGAIAAQGPRRSTHTLVASQRSFNPWLGYTAAAGVLLAVFLSSYFYFRPVAPAPFEMPMVAHRDETPKPPREQLPPPERSAKTQPTTPPSEKVTARESRPPAQASSTKPITERPTAPKPKIESNSILAKPRPKTEVFEVSSAQISFNLTLRDLAEKPSQEQLLQELEKAEGFRLETLSSGEGKALDSLVKAVRASGFQVLMDEVAHKRAKNSRWRTDFALLIEDLTPAEFVQILSRLSKEDQQAAIKRNGKGHFSDLFVLPLTADDQKELSKLLGVESTRPELPRTPTATERKPPRQAIVLAYNPMPLLPGASKEIKRFLEGRAPKRAGTLQILLVLRATD